jgi:NAD(P)-dependent dehydrogenase (short-subunit alcohol dehydrogenase family)
VTILRPDLLVGTRIALAGGVRAAVRDALVNAGASVEELEGGLDEEQAEGWARARTPLQALLFDARRAFGTGGADALRVTLEQAWASTRALANGAFIPAHNGAKIVLAAPSPAAGDHAEAARSALENLARTLSVEWARYAVTVTAVMPGEGTGDDELAELVSFLASPAGSYFSGCRLALGTVPLRDRR